MMLKREVVPKRVWGREKDSQSVESVVVVVGAPAEARMILGRVVLP